MKRMLSILLAMAVVWMLALPCAAAGEGITITNATAKPGETVYLRVALNEDLDGDSIGISYSFDSSLLKDQYRYSTWERNGTMQDFSYKKSGVWANSAAENLQGDICTLAFKVRDNAEFLETKITCYVTIKNDGQLVGEYTAEATVCVPCEHQYGEPVSDGVFGHSNTCELCGHKVTKSHEWQEKEQIEDPENEKLILQISECSVCGEQKETPVELKQDDTIPTDPIHPTEPTVTMPEPTEPDFPTKPQGNASQPGGPDREPEHGDKENHVDDNRDDYDQDDNQNQEPNTQNGQSNHDDKNQPQDNQNAQDDKENSGNSGNSNNGQGEHKGDNDETPPDSPVNPDTHEPGKEDPDGGDAHAGHDHSAEDSHAETTVPKVIFGNDKDETEEHESHQYEHTEEEPQNPNVGAIVVAVVLVALMVGLPVYIFKGRKRI